MDYNFKLVYRKGAPVRMFYCKNPITIDKSEEWGDGNMQQHLSGGWVQVDEWGAVTHLVANNSETNTPVGWVTTVIKFYKNLKLLKIWIKR